MEAQETSKAAKMAYEKFSAEAAQHAKQIEGLEALKEEKLAGTFKIQCCKDLSL